MSKAFGVGIQAAMGQIIALDQNMVNMIAAGEVIERPASVVKELMENGIDAGAAKITVSVEDGGRKLISVTDDGGGMDAEDLTKAFEPHTTSKVRTSSDLLGISTLGFRGEALASIASVAQVRAASRTKDSPGANCIEIDCGNKGRVGPCSGDYGTTIQVRDIFYKLPARRKFLRTANTEMGHIAEQFTRIALSFCPRPSSAARRTRQFDEPAANNLDLTLENNGREVYRLAASYDLRRRVAVLFPTLSSAGAADFIESENEERGMHVFALMGKPCISRTSNKFQYAFLNGRFIRDKFISHAIREAYRGLLEPNRFPVTFLFIQMPYADYDVNVHPTKVEVRFFNTNLVHSQVLGCLRERLLGTNLEIQARIPSGSGLPGSASTPAGGRRNLTIADAMAEFLRKHRPAAPQRHFESAPHRGAGADHRGPGRASGHAVGQQGPGAALGRRSFLQIHDSFIVAQTDDGFVIIDQHALHERIMYECLRKRVEKGRLESQRLLIPESFELAESRTEVLKTNAGLMEKLGIELVPFGPGTVAIQAFPTLLSKADPVDFVRDMVDLLERDDAGADAERMVDEVLNMAACKAAIKAGQKLSDAEIEQLIADGERTDCSSRCPHGRPTTIGFSISDLEKQFKRT